MNKKTKIFIITVILIILGFIGYLTYYKFTKNNLQYSKEQYYPVGDTIDITYDNSYDIKYSESIINENVTEVEYFSTEKDSAIYGSLLIDDDNKLYIYNEKENIKKPILEEKRIKAVKNTLSEGEPGLRAYVLTDDGHVYLIYLYDTNFDNIIVREISFNQKISKFTNLKFTNYHGFLTTENIVLASDDKLYDIVSGIGYSSKIVNINGEYLVFEDGTITNASGKLLVGANGTNIKVKSIIELYEKNIFKFNPFIIIITTDNRIIYLKNQETFFDYGKTILEIKHSNDDIIITFIDKSSIQFKGTYDEKLYPIK